LIMGAPLAAMKRERGNLPDSLCQIVDDKFASMVLVGNGKRME